MLRGSWKMEFDIRLMIILLMVAGVAYGIVAEDGGQPATDDLSLSTGPSLRYEEYPSDVYDSSNRLGEEHNPRCSRRLETALELIRKRQLAKQKTLDLQGYSLHKQLRSVPYDMYVTDMRVRLPTAGSWVRVERCHYNPRNTSLVTKLLFNDLTISGNVNLYRESQERSFYKPEPADTCNMILRLRKAGIGFITEPIRKERGQFNVKTDSHFVEPGFISVYAYGCEPKLREHRRSDDGDEEISREMEDIFLKGIRSLLTTYMQKELQPAIKETLMRNMGYTLSYGR